jgi:acetolactate synthase-1/2/3 large subunit
MSAGDLVTVARVGGPTVMILFNNGCYGWIKALQKLHRGGRYHSVDLDEPIDYVQAARGFGLEGTRIDDPDAIGPAVRAALDHGGPFFIELTTASEHECVPPVAPWQRLAS